MKILTHDQLFHSDEVFAIAILKLVYGDISVIRTRNQDVLDSHINDSEAIVLDVGHVYDAENNNFDHHQDLNLESAAGLIWKHFGMMLCDHDDFTFNFIQDSLIKGVDAWDVNRDDIHTTYRESISDSGIPNLPQLIRNFNRDISNADLQNEQFMKAVDFASQILENSFSSAKVMLQAEKAWENRTTLDNNVLVFDEFCPVWKRKAFENGSENLFGVFPNPRGYAILALDTSIKSLPEIKHKDLIFQHKANFLAVLKTKESALEIAETL